MHRQTRPLYEKYKCLQNAILVHTKTGKEEFCTKTYLQILYCYKKSPGNKKKGKNMLYCNISKFEADPPHPHDYSTHRQTPWTDDDSSFLFAALGKAEPLKATSTPLHIYFPL